MCKHFNKADIGIDHHVGTSRFAQVTQPGTQPKRQNTSHHSHLVHGVRTDIQGLRVRLRYAPKKPTTEGGQCKAVKIKTGQSVIEGVSPHEWTGVNPSTSSDTPTPY